MNSVFCVDILENKGGHNDLIVNFSGLPELRLDTYYFALAIEPAVGLHAIRIAVASLLSYWRTVTQRSLPGQTFYLPIDFSDQYTGCFRIYNQEENLVVTYGFSRLEGHAVDPLDPGDYSSVIDDFNPTETEQVKVDKTTFIFSIIHQIERLRNMR